MSQRINATINWQDGALRLNAPTRVSKEDYKALRDNGFANRRGETVFKAAYSPQRERFLLEHFQLEELEEDVTDTQAEAQARAERFSELADKRHADYESLTGQARQMADAIPFGQPILVGHHSEGRDRRYRERIYNKFRKGYDALQSAEYWQERAKAALRHAGQKEGAPAIHRRLEKLETDLRSAKRHGWDKRWLWFLENRISFEKALLAEMGTEELPLTRDQLEVGGAACWNGAWSLIQRVNQKTVSGHYYGSDLKIPFTEILPGKYLSAAQVRRAVEGKVLVASHGGTFRLTCNVEEVDRLPIPRARALVVWQGDREGIIGKTQDHTKGDPMQTLYTFGYSGADAGDFTTFIRAQGWQVLDTRLAPYSRWQPAWGKKQLALALGDLYTHVEALGNVNYKNGGEIQLKDQALGVALVRRALDKQPVVLLCGCKDVETCHRKYIADQVAAEYGATVVHLTPATLTPPMQEEVKNNPTPPTQPPQEEITDNPTPPTQEENKDTMPTTQHGIPGIRGDKDITPKAKPQPSVTQPTLFSEAEMSAPARRTSWEPKKLRLIQEQIPPETTPEEDAKDNTPPLF